MSKDKLNRYERAFRYVRNIAQQHCESYTQLCLRTDVLVEAIKKAVKYDELQSILEEYNVTPEILREVLLTGQMFRNQPTLDECIKMWEEKDFIVDNNKFCIHLEHIQYQVDMFIHKEEKKYHVHYGYISLELNELLTKTLKALEVNKND